MLTRSWRLFCLVLFLAAASYPLQAQVPEVPSEAAPIPGFTGCLRAGKKMFILEVSQTSLPLRTPRIAAPIRSAVWSRGDSQVSLDVNPDIEFWQLSTKVPLEGTGLVTIEFDEPVLLLNELNPIKPGADGSIWLAAHHAKTLGEKLRYEPQPFKNTVGYWTQADDKARWSFVIDKPGKFNVAVLQGCGNGQGGSLATVSIHRLEEASNSDPLKQDFEVLETGHFQNFQWKQLQSIELKQSGTYALEVMPREIRKNALMDIRAIHLIRLPN